MAITSSPSPPASPMRLPPARTACCRWKRRTSRFLAAEISLPMAPVKPDVANAPTGRYSCDEFKSPALARLPEHFCPESRDELRSTFSYWGLRYRAERAFPAPRLNTQPFL